MSLFPSAVILPHISAAYVGSLAHRLYPMSEKQVYRLRLGLASLTPDEASYDE